MADSDEILNVNQSQLVFNSMFVQLEEVQINTSLLTTMMKQM